MMSANYPATAQSVRRAGLISGALSALLALAVLSAPSAHAAAPAAPAAAKAPAKAPAKGKAKGKGKGGGTAAELTQMLVAKGSQVQDCAVSGALDVGASRVEIATKVTINGRGQVINITTNVKVDKGPDGSKVRECVDNLIRTIQFPASAAPMITIERNWTIAST